MRKATVVNLLWALALTGGLFLPAGRVKADSAPENDILKQKAVELAEKMSLELELEGQEKQVLAEQSWSRGLSLYREGKFPEAAEEFRQALEIYPGHRKARGYLKRCLRVEEAEKEAERGPGGAKAAVEPKSRVEKYLEAGGDYFRRAEYGRAIEEWAKVLPLTEPLSADHLRARILIKEAKRIQMKKEKQETEKARGLRDARTLLEVDKHWLIPARETGEASKEEEGSLEKKKMLAEKARQPVSFSFENAHLRDVILDLSKMSGVNIVVDETIFTETPSGPGAGERYPRERYEIRREEVLSRVISPLVTMSLEGIPLIEALDIILRSKGLRYRLEPNLIYVSTPEGLADEELITRVYHLKTGIAAVPEIELREWEEEYESD